MVPEGLPSDRGREDGAEQEPQQLLRGGGTDRLLPSSLHPGGGGQSRQDVTGTNKYKPSVTVQSSSI